MRSCILYIAGGVITPRRQCCTHAEHPLVSSLVTDSEGVVGEPSVPAAGSRQDLLV